MKCSIVLLCVCVGFTAAWLDSVGWDSVCREFAAVTVENLPHETNPNCTEGSIDWNYPHYDAPLEAEKPHLSMLVTDSYGKVTWKQTYSKNFVLCLLDSGIHAGIKEVWDETDKRHQKLDLTPIQQTNVDMKGGKVCVSSGNHGDVTLKFVTDDWLYMQSFDYRIITAVP